MTDPIALRVIEASQAGAARRAAVALASRLGFNETERGKVALVVTEMANNLASHATGGELILRSLPEEPAGIEILALDRGPGMRSITECLRDGYSTRGTPGKGLGAIARLSAQFDLHSSDSGTAMLARLWSAPGRQTPWAALQLGVVCLPVASEEVCGDAWAVDHPPGRSRMLVADGLGHGPLAATASRAAVEAFQSAPELRPQQMLERLHIALQGTRGAAIAVAELDLDRQRLHYAGVGNISGTLLTEGESSGLVSHNGTVGHQLRKVQEFEHPWPQGSLLLLHSDGLETRCRLDRYPGLATRDPSLIAGVLYRDFRRQRDDVTVLVARAAPPRGVAP